MNKEKLFELFSEAFDKGASFSVHVPQYKKNWEKVMEEEAADLVRRFQAVLGGNVRIESDLSIGVDSQIIKADDIRICVSYFPGKEQFRKELDRKKAEIEKQIANLERKGE